MGRSVGAGPHHRLKRNANTNKQTCTCVQVKHILGRDSGDLTEAGRQYTILLTRFVKAQQERVMVSGTGHEVLILAGTQQVSWAFAMCVGICG